MRSPDDTIRDFVRDWIAKAGSDLAAARALIAAELDDYAPAAFHAQQAAEKWIKAWLVHRQIDIPRTHDLGRLVTIISSQDRVLGDALDQLEQLTTYAVEYRYPGDYSPVTADEAAAALELAEQAERTIRPLIKTPE